MNFFEGVIEGGSFTSGEVSIGLDSYDWVDGAGSGAAWLGVRPEHIAVGKLASEMPFQNEVEVDLFEPTGADTLVYTTLGGRNFHFRLDGQEKISVGQKLTIGFDVSRASIFDKASEDRL